MTGKQKKKSTAAEPAAPKRPPHYYEIKRQVEFTVTVRAADRPQAAYKVAKMPLLRALANALDAENPHNDCVLMDRLAVVRALYVCPGCGLLVHLCDGCGGGDELCVDHGSDTSVVDYDDTLSQEALQLGDKTADRKPSCDSYVRRYRAQQRAPQPPTTSEEQ